MTSEDHVQSQEPGTTTTVRVDRPDGSSVEILRDAGGQLAIVQRDGHGAELMRLTAELHPNGVVSVVRSVPSGSEVLEPQSTRQRSNPYGATLEEQEYEGGISVESMFNDDGDLASVKMSSVWGHQTLELRPDGARTLQWVNGLHQGKNVWDSSGELSHAEVHVFDGTSHTWRRTNGAPDEAVVSWADRRASSLA